MSRKEGNGRETAQTEDRPARPPNGKAGGAISPPAGRTEPGICTKGGGEDVQKKSQVLYWCFSLWADIYSTSSEGSRARFGDRLCSALVVCTCPIPLNEKQTTATTRYETGSTSRPRWVPLPGSGPHEAHSSRVPDDRSLEPRDFAAGENKRGLRQVHDTTSGTRHDFRDPLRGGDEPRRILAGDRGPASVDLAERSKDFPLCALRGVGVSDGAIAEPGRNTRGGPRQPRSLAASRPSKWDQHGTYCQHTARRESGCPERQGTRGPRNQAGASAPGRWDRMQSKSDRRGLKARRPTEAGGETSSLLLDNGLRGELCRSARCH